MSSRRLVVDKVTGTILDIAGCYVIDADQLDDTFTDSEVADLVDRVGHRVIDPCDYTEQDALGLVSYWAERYGWKYAMFTRSEVWHCLVDVYGDATDEQIKAVTGTRMWVKTLEDAIVREGMACVYDAIEQAKQGV